MWRKLHIALDAETLQIRAVEAIQINNVGDSQVLGEPLDQIPKDEETIQSIPMEHMTRNDVGSW